MTCAETETCEEHGAEPEDVELSLSNSKESDDGEWSKLLISEFQHKYDLT